MIADFGVPEYILDLNSGIKVYRNSYIISYIIYVFWFKNCCKIKTSGFYKIKNLKLCYYLNNRWYVFKKAEWFYI